MHFICYNIFFSFSFAWEFSIIIIIIIIIAILVSCRKTECLYIMENFPMQQSDICMKGLLFCSRVERNILTIYSCRAYGNNKEISLHIYIRDS